MESIKEPRKAGLTDPSSILGRGVRGDPMSSKREQKLPRSRGVVGLCAAFARIAEASRLAAESVGVGRIAGLGAEGGIPIDPAFVAFVLSDVEEDRR